MGDIEGIGNLDANGQNRCQIHRLAYDAVLQSHALQKFHDDEGFAVLFADVVNCADVGMVQCRSCPGLTPKSFQCLAIGSQVLG